ncbi:MAG: hypothetical protein NVS3B11_06020 [Collimonas sp.]
MSLVAKGSAAGRAFLVSGRKIPGGVGTLLWPRVNLHYALAYFRAAEALTPDIAVTRGHKSVPTLRESPKIGKVTCVFQ